MKHRFRREKAQLERDFDMEVLGSARKISGLEITRDRSIVALWLSQENYVLKVLEGFNMAEDWFVMTPLADHFRIILRVVSIY